MPGRRLGALAPAAPGAPAAKKATARPTKAPTGPSPSTLGRQLRDTEKEIAVLERRRDRLVGELEAAGADVDVLTRVGKELAALEAELGAAEQRWLDVAEALESAR